MNIVHVHLVLLHFPIALLIVGALVKLGSLAGDRPGLRVAARVCLLIGAVGAVGTAFTGQGAEEIVEEALSVSEAVLEEHEELGMWAAYLAAALFIVELATARVRRGPLPWAAAALALVTAGLTAFAGYTGGRIRHGEAFEVGAGAPAAAVEYAESD